MLHTNTSLHLIKQTVTLSRQTPSGDTDTHLQTSTSAALPLPNPFKALKGLRSSENLTEEEREDEAVTQIHLGETVDLGLLSLKGKVEGIRFDSVEYLASGLVWS